MGGKTTTGPGLHVGRANANSIRKELITPFKPYRNRDKYPIVGVAVFPLVYLFQNL